VVIEGYADTNDGDAQGKSGLIREGCPALQQMLTLRGERESGKPCIDS
jgi:hypothetical protein